ncbi:alpha/beta hydrolase [Mycobacterium sp. CBMA293]|uniref:alpha/beta hydrolase n=1 Tax=unclassified Mycolicibacterium TaxID=2636767 RepID=UPI0012DC3305|nr:MULTISPECIES: alpha/beta hydrolase [unclassified Mycolicibacterium]MUL50012.1 alpha/beta hydrolase [Mycolicibacterium sp. CBMA 360]MUL61934.1 alpha/beta hydrolase [Mycolicibacterium sp. CBMA 335]MUL72583.1 alpha/beta hydrolase [Mycolicibacterium sp. CBMA 311]MUL92778.1 alpha/beta hydrolase [Mycolicibacterium sp. CBMA 230]MUM08782.1 alpha/beta hydrolase [Mycolicibacterium sp. CBMA 213]
MLEVIDKGVCTPEHPVPLLFLHGGCHAAWCWDEHFLDYFAEHGFRAVAPSYRGHGNSGTNKPLRQCTIADYLADARRVAADLGTAPILVGHSTGGFIIQKHFEDDDAPAAVLLASTPPQGIMRGALRVWRNHPWIAMRENIIGRHHGIFNTPALAREHLFSPSTPEEIVVDCAARVENDSIHAVFTDMAFRLPKPAAVRAPVLVLGGVEDGTIANFEVHATARAFGTTAELFPGMGHNMMLEPQWRDVADRIRIWLGAQGF